MAPTNAPILWCPYCKARNDEGTDACRSCGLPWKFLYGELDEGTIPPAGLNETAARRLHLSTVMLSIAVIAIVLGVFREAPGLGILLFILAPFALWRTSRSVARRQIWGTKLSWERRLLTFLVSLGIVFVVGVAAVAAFMVTCLSTVGFGPNAGRNTINAALIAGLAAAGFVIVFLSWLTRPRRIG